MIVGPLRDPLVHARWRVDGAFEMEGSATQEDGSFCANYIIAWVMEQVDISLIESNVRIRRQ